MDVSGIVIGEVCPGIEQKTYETPKPSGVRSKWKLARLNIFGRNFSSEKDIFLVKKKGTFFIKFESRGARAPYDFLLSW